MTNNKFTSYSGMIPVISNWATSNRLTDRSLFPSFTRTVPNTFASAGLAVQLIKNLGYKRFGLIHESSDFGSAYKDAMFSEASRLDISMKFSGYDSRNQISTTQAM